MWSLVKSTHNPTPPPVQATPMCGIITVGSHAHCSLDKGVACPQHIQLPTRTCACAWYECTLTSAHISKCMQIQESLGNMKISGSHPSKTGAIPMSYVAALHLRIVCTLYVVALWGLLEPSIWVTRCCNS